MAKLDWESLRQRSQGILGQEQSFKSAVFLPLLDIDGETCILFEKRAADLKLQPGEICFPGGSIDPSDPNPAYAAIRETSEELGVPREDIRIIAPLDIVVSPFSAIIYPFVGHVDNPQSIQINKSEVEEIFFVPLNYLLEHQPIEQDLNLIVNFPENYPFELVPGGKNYRYRTGKLPQQFYLWQDRIIWGLTARILHHFLALIKRSYFGS